MPQHFFIISFILKMLKVVFAVCAGLLTLSNKPKLVELTG